MNKIIRMSEQGGNLSKNNPLFVYDEQIEKVWPHHQTVPVIEFRCFGELCTPPDTNLEIPPPILHVWLNAPKHMHGHGHLPVPHSPRYPCHMATYIPFSHLFPRTQHRTDLSDILSAPLS